MIIGVVTVPIYLHTIGDARYGVLAIVWLFLGYFGLFDPGITRAATYHIARLHSKEQDKERESVFWTALLLNASFGVLGGLIVYFGGRSIFMTYFNMPEELRAEVMASVPWLAASVPVSIVVGVLGGALQARERFGLFNSISIGSAIVTQLLPLAVAVWWGPDLRVLIPAVLISRTASSIPMGIALIRTLPLGVGGSFDQSRVKPLFNYGGWITLTNFLNPVLTSMDRMLIGSVLNAQSVAFYSVPFNLVTRATIIPGSLSATLFPRLSKVSHEERSRLAGDSVIALAAVMTPLMIISIACLPIFMKYWVGPDFARHAAGVGIVLLVGMWANGLSFIPSEHLQATERPDLIAKFHALEIIPFLCILWVGLHYFGLMGAAWAWSARVIGDGLLLFLVAGKINGWQKILPGGLLVLIASAFAPTSILSIRTMVEFVLVVVALVYSWHSSIIFRRLVREMILARLHRTTRLSTVANEMTGLAVQTASATPPRISIAMATYNGARYIREQLESVAQQTLLPDEIVVTDDGSTDETEAIIAGFAASTSIAVRFLRNETRLRFADNFLHAASLCRGDLIAFCDQDDIWTKDKLSVCARYFSDPEVLLVVHSAQTFTEPGLTGYAYPFFPQTTVHELHSIRPIADHPGFAMVIRRELLSVINSPPRPEVLYGHDTWLWFVAASAGKIATLADMLTLYRQHGANVCGAPPSKGLKEKAKLLAQVPDYLQESQNELDCSALLLETAQTSNSIWSKALTETATILLAHSKIHFLRAKLHSKGSNIFSRSYVFLRIMQKGAYMPRQKTQFLGPRAAAKDLVVGVFRVFSSR